MESSNQSYGETKLDFPEQPQIQDTTQDTTSKVVPTTQEENRFKARPWQPWYEAFKRVWPIYLATHIAFLILTYLSNLFLLGSFSVDARGLHTIVTSWDRWDTGAFKSIAMQGYTSPTLTAFFPLYPILQRGLTFLTQDPLIAGLIISNLAAIVLFMVLYRLVAEDFDQNIAARAVLYVAVFPTAFFLAAAYNESLFICLTLLSFFYMRRGNWWLAGIFGLLASLTRSSGIFLLIPFCYEYLRQHNFQLKAIRISAISGLLIPFGLGLFVLYCELKFRDPLAFSHAQAVWGRELQPPWMTFVEALKIIKHTKVLNFYSIHTVIDLSAGTVMLCLLALSFVGPWRLPRDRWSYTLYGSTLCIFFMLFPAPQFPVQSLSRLVIELFPAFIILAKLGKRPNFNLFYLTIAGSILCFMLLQFLTGYWIV